MAMGETLVSKGVITQDQLDKALVEQASASGERLGDIIVRLGFASKDAIDAAL